MSKTPIYNALAKAIQAETPVALATIIEGKNIGAKLLVVRDVGNGEKSKNADKSERAEIIGSWDDPDLEHAVISDAKGSLETGKSGTFHYGESGERKEYALSVFIEAFSKRPTLFIFGAMDYTGALVRLANQVGYKTIVCDARSIFATKERFPTADEIIVGWPDEVFDRHSQDLSAKDAVCILTHDPKFDSPAIHRALKTKVGYIGVMGSRKTHSSRIQRLKDEGLSKSEIARLRAPIGLDIGARTPEETALSILAEIVATQKDRQGVALSQTEGPIH